MSGEHRGRLEDAYDLIRAAKEAGADAIKVQCFDPAKLAEARGGKAKVLTEGLWKGFTLFDLYVTTYTPRRWFPDLFARAKQEGITLLSSVFDEEGVDFLETLGCPAYKISSFEMTNRHLTGKAAATLKPLIMSTGMATFDEIAHAFYHADMMSARYPALLHCVSAYPCPIGDANIKAMVDLRELTGVVGLSDHTIGDTAAIVATTLGASIIEKHITLSRANGGPDAAFSLEPEEFKRFVADVRDAYASLGTGERPASEEMYRSLRSRSA
jgi:N-acetylneuraminate synthase